MHCDRSTHVYSVIQTLTINVGTYIVHIKHLNILLFNIYNQATSRKIIKITDCDNYYINHHNRCGTKSQDTIAIHNITIFKITNHKQARNINTHTTI